MFTEDHATFVRFPSGLAINDPCLAAHSTRYKNMKRPDSIDIHLPVSARYVLMEAAKLGIDRIDQVTERLRVEHPNAFHSIDSLPERGFAHEPKTGIPHRWYLRRTAPQAIVPQQA
ncbi:hypothetical protein ACN22W_36815 [Burkholderia theae]|uniref:hypothetical protein n=1 Tax=Burkholderia theae TaxID=3143496 RepID=UPI003AFB5A20